MNKIGDNGQLYRTSEFGWCELRQWRLIRSEKQNGPTSPSAWSVNEAWSKALNDCTPAGKCKKAVLFLWHVQRRAMGVVEAKTKGKTICPRDESNPPISFLLCVPTQTVWQWKNKRGTVVMRGQGRVGGFRLSGRARTELESKRPTKRPE